MADPQTPTPAPATRKAAGLTKPKANKNNKRTATSTVASKVTVTNTLMATTPTKTDDDLNTDNELLYNLGKKEDSAESSDFNSSEGKKPKKKRKKQEIKGTPDKEDKMKPAQAKREAADKKPSTKKPKTNNKNTRVDSDEEEEEVKKKPAPKSTTKKEDKGKSPKKQEANKLKDKSEDEEGSEESDDEKEKVKKQDTQKSKKETPDVKKWLEELKIPSDKADEYTQKFAQPNFGYDSVAKLREYPPTEEDLENKIGVTIMVHRKAMIQALKGPVNLGFQIKELEKHQVDVVVDDAIKLVAQTHAMTVKIYQSFSLLKKPANHNYYPISTVSKSNSHDLKESAIWAPFYYYPPLHPATLSMFTTKLSPVENKAQDARLIALYQVTRFGKTKLGYSLGFERFVAVIRFPEITSFSFRKYIDNCSEIMNQAKKLPGSDDLFQLIGTLVIRNYKLVMVWILCYVELLQRLFEKAEFNQLEEIERYEYYLRISSNGISQDLINAIFQNQLCKVADWSEDEYEAYVEHTMTIAKIKKMVFVFDDFLPNAALLHPSLFPHKPDLDLYKQSKSLARDIGQRQLEEMCALSRSYSREIEVYHTGEARHTSLFYAFMTAGLDLTTCAGIPVVFNSTQFKALRFMLDVMRGKGSRDAEFQELHFSALEHADKSMTVDMMMQIICDNLSLFDQEPGLDKNVLRAALLPYEGRYGFFFDIVWVQILPAIVRSVVKTPKELFDYMIKMLTTEWLQALRLLIEGYITKMVDNFSGKYEYLMRRLYYFHSMHNGYTVFYRNEIDAVDAGFGYLVEASNEQLIVRMFGEPEVRNVFIKRVSALFPNMANSLSKIPSNDDPVYSEIMMLHHTNPGLAGEEFTARLFMRLASTKTSLFDALECKKSGVSQESIASQVRFAEISTCGTAIELGVSEVDFLLNPDIKAGAQLRSAYGRVDIITPLEWLDSNQAAKKAQPLPPAATQVKNKKDHITPCGFYSSHGGNVKGALASLDPRRFFPNSPADHEKFVQHYMADPPLYSIYIRIVVSMQGFNDMVYDSVRSYNKTVEALYRPIILVSLMDYIGGQLPSNICKQTQASSSISSQVNWEPILDFCIPPKLTKPVPMTVATKDMKLKAAQSLVVFHSPGKKLKVDVQHPIVAINENKHNQ